MHDISVSERHYRKQPPFTIEQPITHVSRNFDDACPYPLATPWMFAGAPPRGRSQGRHSWAPSVDVRRGATPWTFAGALPMGVRRRTGFFSHKACLFHSDAWFPHPSPPLQYRWEGGFSASCGPGVRMTKAAAYRPEDRTPGDAPFPINTPGILSCGFWYNDFRARVIAYGAMPHAANARQHGRAGSARRAHE